MKLKNHQKYNEKLGETSGKREKENKDGLEKVQGF